MPLPKKVEDYQALSIVYSHLMRTVNYRAWAKYIHSLVNEFLPENPKVLELASGNCKLAKHLKRNYKKIVVSDLSLRMLQSDNFTDGHKICCDMTSLPFKDKFDLIICAFDSINYLTSKKKILKLFSEISKIMKSEAVFTFDASMLANSLSSLRTPANTGKLQSTGYIQKSSFNTKTRIHTNEFIVKDINGRVFKEQHTQKVYDFDFYFSAAEKSGLYVSECFEAFSFTEAKYYNERVQFILRKNKSNAVIR